MQKAIDEIQKLRHCLRSSSNSVYRGHYEKKLKPHLKSLRVLRSLNKTIDFRFLRIIIKLNTLLFSGPHVVSEAKLVVLSKIGFGTKEPHKSYVSAKCVFN